MSSPLSRSSLRMHRPEDGEKIVAVGQFLHALLVTHEQKDNLLGKTKVMAQAKDLWDPGHFSGGTSNRHSLRASLSDRYADAASPVGQRSTGPESFPRVSKMLLTSGSKSLDTASFVVGWFTFGLFALLTTVTA